MIGAYSFKTKIGIMALAWELDKILSVQMPEANKEELLVVLRARFKKPELNWAKNTPIFVIELAEKIQLHLSGTPQKFSLKQLNMDQFAPFHKRVYENTIRIPNGKVLTYGEIAKNAGSPKAFRAVGQAMAKNPFPLVIPCHRVVGSTGGLVGYSAHGGTITKKKILEIENCDQPNRS